jgi:hypothetical protein
MTDTMTFQNIDLSSCDILFKLSLQHYRTIHFEITIRYLMWRVYPLLGNDSVNTFPRSVRMQQNDVRSYLMNQ